MSTVRKEVAKNVNTPANILEKLAHDSDDLVRQKVAQNQQTTVEVLERLTNDKCIVVAEAARKRIAAKLNVS